MDAGIISALGSLFSSFWTSLSKLIIPGTDWAATELLLASGIATLLIKFFRIIVSGSSKIGSDSPVRKE